MGTRSCSVNAGSAAKIEGELVYESKNILQKRDLVIRRCFLPSRKRNRGQLVEDAETNGSKEVGYKFLMELC